MGRVYAITLNTFREAVRDRVLYGVLSFATLVLVFTLALGELSLNQQQRIVYDVGLASISLFSVVVAIFLGSSLLYKEIERKTLYVILPKPIRRYQFLVGKYLGIVMTVTVFIGIMGAIQLLVSAVQAGASVWLASAVAAVSATAILAARFRLRDATVVLWPWLGLSLAAASWLCIHANVDLEPLWAQLVLTVGESLVLAAVALLFSSFSSPFLTGVLSFGVWLAGRSADAMATMDSRILSEEIERALHVLAEFVPNFNLFVPGHHALTAEMGSAWTYVGFSMTYAVGYAALLLFFASLIFRRRDFV